MPKKDNKKSIEKPKSSSNEKKANKKKSMKEAGGGVGDWFSGQKQTGNQPVNQQQGFLQENVLTGRSRSSQPPNPNYNQDQNAFYNLQSDYNNLLGDYNNLLTYTQNLTWDFTDINKIIKKQFQSPLPKNIKENY